MISKIQMKRLIILGLIFNLISQSNLSVLSTDMHSSLTFNSKTSFDAFDAIENVSINYIQPITNRTIPVLILFPSSDYNVSLPVLVYASGYFSKPGTIGYPAYFDYLIPIVQAGYVVIFPEYSMAYYEATQQGGAEILIAIKNYVLDIWNNQTQDNKILLSTNVGYFGISDGGGIAIIAGILDPYTQSVIAFTPYITHNQLNFSLANFKPHLLAIGGTLDQGATADKLDFLSDLLNYNERQIYIVFKNSNHFGYYYDPYIDLSISLSLVFCNYVFKGEFTDYQTYFGDTLFSTDLAYELRILEGNNDVLGRTVFIGLLIFLVTLIVFFRYRSKKRETQLRLKVQQIRQKQKLERANKKHS